MQLLERIRKQCAERKGMHKADYVNKSALRLPSGQLHLAFVLASN